MERKHNDDRYKVKIEIYDSEKSNANLLASFVEEVVANNYKEYKEKIEKLIDKYKNDPYCKKEVFVDVYTSTCDKHGWRYHRVAYSNVVDNKELSTSFNDINSIQSICWIK